LSTIEICVCIAHAHWKWHNKVMTKKIKIQIIGSGAIGSLLGGLLAAKNHQVAFISNEKEHINQKQLELRIILPDSFINSKILMCRPGQEVDIVIVALKRFHLKNLSKEFFANFKLAPGGKMLFLNCDSSLMRSLVPDGVKGRAALTLLNAVQFETGEVELCSKRSLLLIERDKEFKKVMNELRSNGLEIKESDDIESAANSFFILQLLNLPVAMCNTTLNYFLSFKEGREIAVKVLEEGVAAMMRSGRKLKELPFMDPQELLKSLHKHGDDFDVYRFHPDRCYNTILQSIIRNKMTETKELNGQLVKIAGGAGVNPLWNWRLTQKLSRVLKVGFYNTPIDLFEVLK